MVFFGHRFIPSQNFYHIFDIDGISHTPPSSALYLEFSEKNLDIIEHLQKNDLTFALNVANITELLYGSALGASYITIDKTLAKTAQGLAENYLFDAKILVHVEDEEEIEELALLGVDGVIFAEAVIKIT
ncbi:MAG: hypothetical protein ABXS93_06980 [Sulfurimonas sp.]